MIVLYTDFGYRGPYVGQMKAVLHQAAPGLPVVDLMHDAPACDPKAAAYLLAALVAPFPAGSVFLAVVDPGVGGSREAVVLRADGRWYVGPDNGLLQIVAGRAGEAQWWRIDWRPETISASFHGRDLFAPVAGWLARGRAVREFASPWDSPQERAWPEDLARIVYVDAYGNAISGYRAHGLAAGARVSVGSHTLRRARTFSHVGRGEAFWYENSLGLVEIAINQGRAAERLGLRPGDALTVEPPLGAPGSNPGSRTR